jgi:3-deoxy-D-arabino-heptulosonate 7-phosphate (DAHP) synthase class II
MMGGICTYGQNHATAAAAALGSVPGGVHLEMTGAG